MKMLNPHASAKIEPAIYNEFKQKVIAKLEPMIEMSHTVLYNEF